MNSDDAMSTDAKRAMFSQFIGLGLDMYDMAVLIVMAPLLTKVFALHDASLAWQYLEVVFLYSIAMAARPLGSAFFGHYADKIGRRRLLLITMGGVGVMSLMSALTPTGHRVGSEVSYLIFSIIRLFMGIFFGGECACGHAFAIEHAPRQRRGFVSGFVQSGFSMGFAFAAIVVMTFSLWLGEKAMEDYGWRFVFATGTLPAAFALWIRSYLVESPEFERIKCEEAIAKTPFLTLFKPPTLWVFLQVSILMTGFFLTNYAIYQYLPSILKGPGKFSLVEYTIIYAVALFASGVGYVLFGWLTDKFGRKRLTQLSFVIVAFCGIPIYKLLMYSAATPNFTLAILAGVAAGMFKINWGVVPAYLSERFPTQNRSVGVGFGYSVGALVGGAGITGLVALIHSLSAVGSIEGPNELWLSASTALTIGAALCFSMLALGPETNNLELSETGIQIEPIMGKESIAAHIPYSLPKRGAPFGPST